MIAKCSNMTKFYDLALLLNYRVSLVFIYD
jgi:hypothetical protein